MGRLKGRPVERFIYLYGDLWESKPGFVASMMADYARDRVMTRIASNARIARLAALAASAIAFAATVGLSHGY
jgi:hypothetical protein